MPTTSTEQSTSIPLQIQFTFNVMNSIARSATEISCVAVVDERPCSLSFTAPTGKLYSQILDQLEHGWVFTPNRSGEILFYCPIHPPASPYPMTLLPHVEV